MAHWTQVSNRCPLGYLFQAFLPLDRIFLFMVQVRKIVANGVVFLTFGAIAFGAI